jgi:hypothetical protein
MSDMPRCATCKRWLYHQGAAGYGYCLAVPREGEPAPECSPEPDPDPPAMISDPAYRSQLVTLPTFGCVLHEAKP